MGNSAKKTTPSTQAEAEIILVGCGCPLRGMGWYHAVQLLGGECPSGKLSHIVEPWFLGAGASGPGGAEFAEFKAKTEKEHGVQFHTSMADVPSAADGVKRLALISGRTGDNPKLLGESIAAGCTIIYLEKPGAPTVAELEAMKKEAADANVQICMGYNKNVCKYVRNAREFAAKKNGSHVTFVSNNTYENNAASLGECFERNAEGMLKNMAIHELALLASFYDVTVDNIDSVTVDKEFSSCQTLTGPSGKDFTDFDKVKFTIKTKNGNEVSVQADRCGGDVSYASVSDVDGKELFRHSMPDDEDEANVSVLEAKYPGAMPYFFSQDPDYITVKERVAKLCATGEEAKDIATIDIAIAALSVAEYLTPLMQKELASSSSASDQAEVVLVGCGAPLRGMGWYHAVQLLGGECPSAKMTHIVEPWFLGAGASGPGGPEFAEFKTKTEAEHGVQFHTSLAALPAAPEGVKRLALISGRTGDNPRLLGESIAAGCTIIYLEKPGAPTVAELEAMKEQAANANVQICMGYNKNVCKYVRNAREFASANDGSHVTFVSNNTYENNAASLGECFERNAEGMLKNMAIHELALLASFYDVTVDNIDSVTVDKEFSSCQTLTGPSGKDFTDFDKVKFTIKTKNGNEVSVQADRCGGDVSYASVSDVDGKELFRHSMPDDEDEANVSVLEAKYPGAMPYFFSQDPDYITVKERVAKLCATGEEAKDIATIDIAIAALSVAEYLTPLMQEELR